MSDPVREQHERDGLVTPPPFPTETRPDQSPDAQRPLAYEHRPPVLGVLLLFILVFWGGVAAFFLLR